MTDANSTDPFRTVMGLLFRAHPWHGVPIGPNAPHKVTSYIEIVPTDTVKYELDKATGLLKLDRPQRYSNVCPALYGLIPQTLCGGRVGTYCSERAGRSHIVGDGDPLDICILTEKHFSHGDILCQAIPIGGLRMIDGEEADDKIIAVLPGDAAYGNVEDVEQCPPALVERLHHYFLTYKTAPDAVEKNCEITHIYGHEEAREVIRLSQADYHEQYASIEDLLSAALRV